MDLADFDYRLPAELIAQEPAARRDGARLLRIDRARRALFHHRFTELPALLRPGDCVVLNDSRVIPARVLARDAGDRPVELLFVEPVAPGRWRALVRPGRRCPPGAELRAGGEDGARLRVVGREDDGGRVIERLEGTVEDLLEGHGAPPLPPYITRHAKPALEDWERYQTVYADPPGSVAAPTAGLHFTERLLERLKDRGVALHKVTLHVGAGTFLPVKADDTSGHKMHAEFGTLSTETAEAINATRAAGGRIVAVGSTALRLLETATGEDGQLRAFSGETAIFITPGYKFRAVDLMLTNFHLPRSTLFMLVAAFSGLDVMKRAYAHAIETGYRFYSYGDACLLFRPPD